MNSKYKKLISAKNALIFTILTFFALLITNGVPFIYSDGYASYHISYSIVNEKSFVQQEEPEYFDYRGHVISKFRDQYSVVYAPGAAILNAPGAFIAELFKSDSATIYTDFFMATNGHTVAEGISYLLTGTIFGILTIIFLYKTLRGLDVSERISILSTTFSYIGSYAIWYVILNPTFSHTYELFGIAFGIWGYVLYNKTKKDKFAFYSGLGFGLAVISRPVLAISAVLFFIGILQHRKIKSIILYIAGGLPSAILWMWYNYVSYGKPITSGYNDIRGETFNFAVFNGHNILFSFYRGWFIYSPIFILGVVGIYFLYKKNKFLAISSIISIASVVIIYGFWPAWWAGGSYGHRFMIPAMPFAAMGLGMLLNTKVKIKKKNITKYITIIAIAFTTWTLALTFLYRFTPVAELIPRDIEFTKPAAGDRYTPLDIFEYHIELVQNAESIKDYFGDFINSGNGGSSLVPYFLGQSNLVLRVDERNPEELVLRKIVANTSEGNEVGEVEGFILLGNSNKYEFKIINFSNKESFVLNCSENLCESSTNVIINPVSDNKKNSLTKDEYVGIRLNSIDAQIFFRNQENIFYKGRVIDIPEGTFEYSF